ncbi:hypothetical protein M1L60_04350 [Actinoplanes sp. TRM 88003]|uniref:Uncharacterized protein n=1 Tax=Paractinoplanes aksuensis TaxID=2939490 RepID=A0ABT1DG57_9ACTN|nr:hypothetical protein [Actinoplanes aksuensis]MCO8269821.1 hypothetical protein [Actinoplanes aksuensis]
MRLPRFLLAGVLLAGSVLLLTELFAYRASGAVAFSIFTSVWLTLSIVNAGLGVFSAGYRPSEEAAALLPVFGLPAALAGVAWWAWPDGPTLPSPRLFWFLLAGLALWAAIALLAALLIPHATRETALRTAVAIFLPLWLALQVVNLLVGVLIENYSVAEELLILALNFVLTAAMPLAASRLAQRG